MRAPEPLKENPSLWPEKVERMLAVPGAYRNVLVGFSSLLITPWQPWLCAIVRLHEASRRHPEQGDRRP